MGQRVIKFRAWDGKRMLYSANGEFYWNSDMSNVQIASSTGHEFYDKPYPFMQFTGLLDNNGKEIYEGDIMQGPSIQKSYRVDIGKVIYFEDYGAYIVQGKYSKNQHHENLTCDIAIDFEIVGNIHETKELLNQ